MNDINAKTLNGLKVSDAALAIPFLNYGLKNNDIKSLVTLLRRHKSIIVLCLKVSFFSIDRFTQTA